MVVLPWSRNIPEIRFYGHGGPTMESQHPRDKVLRAWWSYHGVANIPEIRFYGYGGPTMESTTSQR